MPSKCGIVNCNGNYNNDNKCRVFKLPKEECEKQKWLDVLPPRKDFIIDPAKFFICERHWPSNTTHVTRPGVPQSIFNVPASCLPTHKPAPRKPKEEDVQLKHFFHER